MSWHTLPAAQRILSGLTADDMSLKVHTPVAGDRVYQWSAGYKHYPLEQLRQRWIEGQIGTLEQADAEGRTEEYIEAWGRVPYVEAVLADMFGPVPHYGSWPREHADRMAAIAVSAVLDRRRAA